MHCDMNKGSASDLRSIWMVLFLILLGTGLARAEIDGDPFYQRITTPEESFLAIRPFYSDYKNVEKGARVQDFLWPLYTRKHFYDETYGRLLFFGFQQQLPEDGQERYRNWLIPFWFSGMNAQGERYFALFPIGGTINEFLGRDEFSFVLWPLYSQGRINDVETTSILWPIYSRTTGNETDRFRIWPFYGHSVRDNLFDRKFILWPLYNEVRYAKEEDEGGFILFPLYGRIATEKATSYWVLPPFFRYTKGEERALYAPWPFIQWADGTKKKLEIWPLFGRKQFCRQHKNYYLWPFIHTDKNFANQAVNERWRVYPFFHREKTTPLAAEEVDKVESYWKIWPVMSWEKKGDQSRLRLLEFWPFRYTAGIERNWAPLWTLYRREASAHRTDHHLLWGLYRQHAHADVFEWSLLKGLAGYKRTSSAKQYRVLFFRFGNDEKEMEP